MSIFNHLDDYELIMIAKVQAEKRLVEAQKNLDEIKKEIKRRKELKENL